MGKFSSLSGSSLRRRRPLEDEDPASGLSNLADCMLVLACGLMTALVVAWNLDLQNITEVKMTDNKTEIEDIENIEGDFETGGSSYVDVGRVYQDPDTGKFYVLEGA
jgi:hypothetical protein